MKRNEEIVLSQTSILAIAKEVARLLRRDEMPDLVTTEEAASILGITPSRMRQIKDKFPHTKRGSNMQGKLMFRKADLLTRASS